MRRHRGEEGVELGPVTVVPVGLLGEQTMTTFVRSVTASAMASSRCRWSAPTGTCTDTAPATAVTIG